MPCAKMAMASGQCRVSVIASHPGPTRSTLKIKCRKHVRGIVSSMGPFCPYNSLRTCRDQDHRRPHLFHQSWPTDYSRGLGICSSADAHVPLLRPQLWRCAEYDVVGGNGVAESRSTTGRRVQVSNVATGDTARASIAMTCHCAGPAASALPRGPTPHGYSDVVCKLRSQ